MFKTKASSEEKMGIIQIASNTEVIEGTENGKAVSPKKAKDNFLYKKPDLLIENINFNFVLQSVDRYIRATGSAGDSIVINVTNGRFSIKFKTANDCLLTGDLQPTV
jgi:hypothetical protein